MRKIKYVFVVLSVFVWTFAQLSAQNTAAIRTNKKKQTRLEKKIKRLKKEAASRDYLINLMEHKNFVFQADKLYLPNGDVMPLSTDVNYFAVNGDTAVLQFVFKGLKDISFNGLGGVTAKGLTSRYMFSPGNANRSMMVTGYIHPQGTYGNAYYVMTVDNLGYAKLEVTVKGEQINMAGQVTSLDKARIFEGNTPFDTGRVSK